MARSPRRRPVCRQSQRIALARAFYGGPNLLVLDEPNAFLDQAGEEALAAAVKEERKRGATILIVAHRRALLESADRLLVMEGGRVKLLGPTLDVVARLAGPQTEKARAADRA
jgi:ABC-type protease/lipase transport system fused ATPase/permease subunit